MWLVGFASIVGGWASSFENFDVILCGRYFLVCFFCLSRFRNGVVGWWDYHCGRQRWRHAVQDTTITNEGSSRVYTLLPLSSHIFVFVAVIAIVFVVVVVAVVVVHIPLVVPSTSIFVSFSRS